ncbi:hypothetical protein NHU87_26015 [Pseudomonas mandelii]|nr:hypothetical protein [Pseudomonas mandelii]MCO8314101.1 hypothetical protein [Pseudomonas mandelii]
MPIGQFDWLEAVDEGDDLFGQYLAKLACANRAADCKRPQLDQRFHGAHEMLKGLGGPALRPFDDPFEGFVEQLIGHVRHHRFPQHGHERCHDERRGLKNRRSNVDQRIPEGPTGSLVDVCRRDSDGFGVIQDFVEFGLIQVLPQIVVERREGRLQVGPVKGRFPPGGFRTACDGRVPLYFAQPIIEAGEEKAALLMVHEPAEKLLVLLRTQLTGQLNDHLKGRGVFLDWVFWVIRDIRHHAGDFLRLIQVRGEHDNTGERCGHQGHVVTQHGLPIDP